MSIAYPGSAPSARGYGRIQAKGEPPNSGLYGGLRRIERALKAGGCFAMVELMAKKIKVTKRPKKYYPERTRDVPVTQIMLMEVRDELSEKMQSNFHDLKSMIHGTDGKFSGVEAKIDGVKSDIHGIKADFHGMKSDIHGMKSELHRVALLVEEQNARNAIVLDGLTSLFTRQDRVEHEVRDLRKVVEQAK